MQTTCTMETGSSSVDSVEAGKVYYKNFAVPYTNKKNLENKYIRNFRVGIGCKVVHEEGLPKDLRKCAKI